MTLGFSQEFPWGEPTNFLGKIWCGLGKNGLVTKSDLDSAILQSFVQSDIASQFPKDFDQYHPKIHTLRFDPHNRWHVDSKVQMVYGNRTKNRIQFAPTIPCTDVSIVKIVHAAKWGPPCVFIEDSMLTAEEVELLALNDGFDSVDDFYRYFSIGCKLKLIQWTNFRY